MKIPSCHRVYILESLLCTSSDRTSTNLPPLSTMAEALGMMRLIHEALGSCHKNRAVRVLLLSRRCWSCFEPQRTLLRTPSLAFTKSRCSSEDPRHTAWRHHSCSTSHGVLRSGGSALRCAHHVILCDTVDRWRPIVVFARAQFCVRRRCPLRLGFVKGTVRMKLVDRFRTVLTEST
jgi:hypothetical protein